MRFTIFLSVFIAAAATADSAAEDKFRVLSTNEEFTANPDTLNLSAPNPHQPGAEPVLKRSTNPRDIFARAICYAPNTYCGTGCCPSSASWCCENTSCMDATTSICCKGGKQCLTGQDCCMNGCCNAGTYCVQNLRTLAYSCRAYLGSNPSVSPSITTRVTASITRTLIPTQTSITDTPRLLECTNKSHLPCPDQKFCCPSLSYCYYDPLGKPMCWEGLGYYTYWWYYSWSYSYGVRWYRTTTSVDLYEAQLEHRTEVPRLSTAVPTREPDTGSAVPSPTGEVVGTAEMPMDTATATSTGPTRRTGAVATKTATGALSRGARNEVGGKGWLAWGFAVVGVGVGIGFM